MGDVTNKDEIMEELRLYICYGSHTATADDVARRLRIYAQALQPDDYPYGTIPVQIDLLAELVNEVSGQSVLPPMEAYHCLDSHPLVKKGVGILEKAGYDRKAANKAKWCNLAECLKDEAQTQQRPDESRR